MDKDFKQFYDQQPDTHKQLLDACQIEDFADLKEFAQQCGVKGKDPQDIMQKLMYKKGFIHIADHIKDLMTCFENIIDNADDEEDDIFDYDTPSLADLDLEDDEDDEDNPFAFPKNCILDREEVFEFHIRMKLNNSPIPIWREIKIPSNVSLEFFAFVIIETMGWYNDHLHCFRTKEHDYKNTPCIKQDKEWDDMFYGRSHSLDTNDYAISDVLSFKGKRIVFEYDFGDSWEHDIWVKGVRKYEEGEEPKVLFVKGKGICPPEDCGGVGGYASLLDLSQKKRKTKEEKEHLLYYNMFDILERNELVDFIGLQEILDDYWQRAKDNE